MTDEERNQFRIRDQYCAVWTTTRLRFDTACLMPMPCIKHAHLTTPAEGDA